MDCKEVREMMPLFLEDDLELGLQCGFMDHIASCDTCMRELEDNFLIFEGLKKLEDGGVFDFEKEFSKKLSESRGFVRLAFRIKTALGVLIALVAIVLLGFGFGLL